MKKIIQILGWVIIIICLFVLAINNYPIVKDEYENPRGDNYCIAIVAFVDFDKGIFEDVVYINTPTGEINEDTDWYYYIGDVEYIEYVEKP